MPAAYTNKRKTVLNTNIKAKVLEDFCFVFCVVKDFLPFVREINKFLFHIMIEKDK
jgi:hypothetical protein